MNVSGKTAIITGAGSGINLSFAKLLLEKGCNVVIADLALRPEAQAVVADFPLTSAGAKAVFQKTDVTQWAQLDKMFEAAIENFGGADIICPGAGIYEPPFSNFWTEPGTSTSKVDPANSRYALLDINVTHPIRVTQMAISHFLANKKPGVVVHISSVGGQVPFFPTPMYVATKHATNGFVRSLAPLETPPADTGLPRIRVVAVAPARILTPLWTDHPEKLKMVGDQPGWVTPEAVAEVMLDLVQKDENIGGTIMEIGNTVRRVETYNDGGPRTGNNHVESGPDYDADMWASLKRQLGGK